MTGTAPLAPIVAVEHPDENSLTVYTDGSMFSSPRRQGGAGILFVMIDAASGEELYEERVLPSYIGASQNLMELSAVVQAIKIVFGSDPPFHLRGHRRIVIKTDSAYVAQNVGTAQSVWARNGYLDRNGNPVANAPVWKDLVRFMRRAVKEGRRIKIVQIPGKKGPRAKRVDKLAKASARLPSSRQLIPSQVRRKPAGPPIEIGSVPIRGQEMTIKVFKSEWQREHGLMKYWYTVLDGPFAGRSDVIFSQLPLNHRRYRIRVSAAGGQSRIVEVLEELDASTTTTQG